MDYNMGCVYFVEYGNSMFKQLLVLCLMSIALVSCTAFGDNIGSGVDSPNVGSKEGSDMLFDQTLNAPTSSTKEAASSTK